MKFCSKCEVNTVNSVQSWCRACINEYSKEYRKKNKEKRKAYYRKNKKRINQRSKDWHAKNRDKVREHQKKNIRTIKARFRTAVKNSERRNKEWKLTLEEFENTIGTPCFYCHGYFGKVETGAGLDRLDNEKGYELNNVVSCCFTCNKIKNDTLTTEEAKSVITLVISMRK